MMAVYCEFIWITLLGIARDKIIHTVLFVSALFLIFIPVLSQFSMRQSRELAITLALTFSSMFLLFIAVMLGSSTIWRDIEKRYTPSVLCFPIVRRQYLLGRFLGVALFVLLCGVLFAFVGGIVIYWHSDAMSSGLSVLWSNIAIAYVGDILKAILLVAISILFSTVSTSLFLPVFGSLAVYFAGSASQEVMNYLSTEAGMQLPLFSKIAAKAFYYVLPNFEIFNFKVAAVYGLALPAQASIYALLYFFIYTLIVLLTAMTLFNRRELP